jgi:chromosome segregation ATPase
MKEPRKSVDQIILLVQGALSDWAQQFSVLEGELEHKDSRIAFLQAELDDLSSRVEVIYENRDCWKSEAAGLESQLKDKKLAIGTLKKELRVPSKRQLDHWQNKAHDLEVRITEREAGFATLEEALHAREHQLSNLRAELDSRHAEPDVDVEALGRFLH